MHGEITTTRYQLATGTLWPGRTYALRPAQWPEAARTLAATGPADPPVEVRVRPAALAATGPDTMADTMLAASALRDAGIGLALDGAGRPEHLRWLRLLPWSTVIAHPALLGTAGTDRRRFLDTWVEAACRRGLHCVAPVPHRSLLPALESTGFTHGEVAAPSG